MLIQLAPGFVCIVGLIAYALAVNPKAAEMGRIAFAVGLLVALYTVGSLRLG